MENELNETKGQGTDAPNTTPPTKEQHVPYSRFVEVNRQLQEARALLESQKGPDSEITKLNQALQAQQAALSQLQAAQQAAAAELAFARATGVTDPEAHALAEWYYSRLPPEGRPASAAVWVSTSAAENLPHALVAVLGKSSSAPAVPAPPSAPPSAPPGQAPSAPPTVPAWRQASTPPPRPATPSPAEVQQIIAQQWSSDPAVAAAARARLAELRR